MNTPATGREDVSYLAPLFNAAATYRGDNHFLLLPSPADLSGLAKDDEPLKSWGAAKFIQSSFSAGLIHVEAFTQLVVVAHQVDPYSPWTLLRGALENFATAAWLLAGEDQGVRRHRVLSLWAEDFRNRDRDRRTHPAVARRTEQRIHPKEGTPRTLLSAYSRTSPAFGAAPGAVGGCG